MTQTIKKDDVDKTRPPDKEVCHIYPKFLFVASALGVIASPPYTALCGYVRVEPIKVKSKTHHPDKCDACAVCQVKAPHIKHP